MRWLRCALAMVVMTGVGCRGESADPPAGVSSIFTKTFAGTINRNVDILFLIDDSGAMRMAQDKLIAAFPSFVATLQGSPNGLPNLHIGVVSSDMGAGDGSIASCDSRGGRQGIFQYTARGTCTATNLNQGSTFISNVAGVANYTGALENVFGCIAALGETGCSFEHQFAALLRALGADGRPAPAENQGFLRRDAYLAVIMLTNEDDCSAWSNVPLFDTGSNTNVASQLGPPTSFRCNEFGHLCVGAGGQSEHPTRAAPNNDAASSVTYSSCRSNDAEAYLLSASDTANHIKALKDDPSQVIVASIQGPSSPYTVRWRPPLTADTSCGAASCPWPEIAHSCSASDASFADPGVRTGEFVSQFGANGLVLPFCTDSFAPTLQRVGQAIEAQLLPPCIPGPIQQIDGMPRPDCKVTQHVSNGNGGVVDSLVPWCADNGGMAPCWQLVPGPAGLCDGSILDVSVDPNLSSTTARSLTVSCALCVAGTSDPARGCP